MQCTRVYVSICGRRVSLPPGDSLSISVYDRRVSLVAPGDSLIVSERQTRVPSYESLPFQRAAHTHPRARLDFCVEGGGLI